MAERRQRDHLCVGGLISALDRCGCSRWAWNSCTQQAGRHLHSDSESVTGCVAGGHQAVVAYLVGQTALAAAAGAMAMGATLGGDPHTANGAGLWVAGLVVLGTAVAVICAITVSARTTSN